MAQRIPGYGATVSRSVDARAVEHWISRVRLRAVAMLGVRALVGGAGACLALATVGALALGPLAPAAAAWGVWAISGVAALIAAGLALRPALALRGSGVARLAPTHASAVRSAFELSHGVPAGASSELAAAAVARAARSLGALPAPVVVPLSWLVHPSTRAGGAALLLAALALGLSERASSGMYALLHPGAEDEAGMTVALVVSDVEAELVHPAYLGRPSLRVRDPGLIEAPVGTSLELWARPRVEAASMELALAGRTVRMERGADGRFSARLILREDGAITLRVRDVHGATIRDGTSRAVRLARDEAPRVSLIAPAIDVTVDLAEEIVIAYDASDDVGLTQLELVARMGDGREQRRRLSAHDPSIAQHAGTERISLGELGAAEGDHVTVWVEARDGDDVSGPNVGRSESRTLTVESAATRREEGLAELAQLLEVALGALADRLEVPVPDDDASARARFERLRGVTEQLLSGLGAYALRVRESEEGRRADAALYEEMQTRVRRLLFEEMRLSGGTVAPRATRERTDARARAEMESDVLALDDLLARARIDDAAAIARELEQLRREIASLLAELRRAQTDEARREILAAISRAEQRLRDLRSRMSQMGTAVPQEFANAQEQSAQQTQEALAQMREAIERGDLDAAAQALTRLEQQIDSLARALGGGAEAFAEEHFGPRDRAVADAIDRLLGLESEQRELARRTGETRASAARRAIDAMGEDSASRAQELARRARAVRETLEHVDRDRLVGLERDAFDAARQRLRDTEDTLGAGDLGEASRMAEEGLRQLADLERDLDLDSMMFAGHSSETSASARSAREARAQMGELLRDLDRAIPDLERQLAPGERGQLTGDVPRQRGARDAADRLAETFEHGAPDGSALSEEAGQALRELRQHMDQASQHLERAELLDAARAQDEAAERLTELRRQLEEEQRGGGGGGGDDGMSAPDFRRPVRIPEAERFEGPMELRRRLLDAMGDAPPAGYEDSVQRYYEGLLR